MKRLCLIPLVLFAAMTMSAAAKPNYTLYYLDPTHSISKIAISPSGKPAGKPRRLGPIARCESYSVSPNERFVIGVRCLSEEKMLWQCFVQRLGSVRTRVIGKIDSDGPPGIVWTHGSEKALIHGGQVTFTTLIYSPSSHKVTYSTSNFLDLSYDGRYATEVEDKGDVGEGDLSRLWIVDLDSGRTTLVGTTSADRDRDYYRTWVGTRRRFAFIGKDRNVWIGKIDASQKPIVRNWRLTNNGHYQDLQYATGKGLRFRRKIAGGFVGYCSSDLRTVRKTKLVEKMRSLPSFNGPDGAWSGQTEDSPDSRLSATAYSRKDVLWPRLAVTSLHGSTYHLGQGKLPRWKDTKPRQGSAQ